MNGFVHCVVKSNVDNSENQEKHLIADKLTDTRAVADPDRCHGLQETYENCQLKFNTIYNFFFCKNNKQGDDDSIFRRGDNFVQIRENSYQTSCVEASCQGDWLFASCDQLR